jgi:uncharacterized protein
MVKDRLKKIAFWLLVLFWVTPRLFFLLATNYPQPQGYVNDFAQLFSPTFRSELETDLQNFEKETTAEIAITTIGSLEGNTIENYAVSLFEQWQIGKKEKDNGILVLIAKEERKIRIEVGYGLEPVVTDGRAGRIIREQITPAFREGNYDQGVAEAVVLLEQYIRSDEAPSALEQAQEEVQEKVLSSLPLMIFGIAFLLYFSSFLGRSKEIWPGGALGAAIGLVLGNMLGGLTAAIPGALGFGLFGLLLDLILSRNYQKRKKSGKPTDFFSSWGGFSGGGGGSGGFGGFGGGSSGGGGASGGW